MESKHLQKSNQSIHLISLLSTFIEQKWRAEVKTDEDVLKFVVTWIPMDNYFKRFGKKRNQTMLAKLSTGCGCFGFVIC